MSLTLTAPRLAVLPTNPVLLGWASGILAALLWS